MKNLLKKVLKFSLVVTALGLFALVFMLIWVNITSSELGNEQTTNKPVDSNIECYINGRQIFTSRENCQQLSQSYQIQSQGQKPVIRQEIQIPPMPTIDKSFLQPQNTTCAAKYNLDGSFAGYKCRKTY